MNPAAITTPNLVAPFYPEPQLSFQSFQHLHLFPNRSTGRRLSIESLVTSSLLLCVSGNGCCRPGTSNRHRRKGYP